jgi:hypothetical protein
MYFTSFQPYVSDDRIGALPVAKKIIGTTPAWPPGREISKIGKFYPSGERLVTDFDLLERL